VQTHSPAQLTSHSTAPTRTVRLAIDPESERAFVQVCFHAYDLAVIDLARIIAEFPITIEIAPATHVPRACAFTIGMVFVPRCSIANYTKEVKQVTCHAFHQLQAYPMFARFHYSIRPKTIVKTTLADFCGHDVAFSAKLEDFILKPINASQIQQR
jgi:hypothetical protein